MTNEELVALIQAGDHVQENMAQLWQQNRQFIAKIALPFSKTCEMDDLIQEGYFGLEKAVQQFNPDEGCKFLTYAEHWIRQVIQRYCQNNGHLKRVPVHLLEQISKYQKFHSDFQAMTQGEKPTDGDYCYCLGITPNKLKELRKYMGELTPVSLYEPISGTDDLTLEDTFADGFDLEEAVVDAVGAEQVKGVIWGAVADLGGQEADIIEGQYLKEETLEAIGNRLNISGERVRQIRTTAIRTLRGNRHLKEAAEVYGYNSQSAYHGGLQRFRETGSSSTEYLAIKHIEQVERKAALMEQAHDLTGTITPVVQRMRQKYCKPPIGIRKLEEINAEIDKCLNELQAIPSKR